MQMLKWESTVLGLSLAVYLGLPVPAYAADSPSPAPHELLGRWIGIAHDANGQFHASSLVDIEIREDSNGAVLVDHDRARSPGAPVPAGIEGRGLHAQYTGLWPTAIQIDGRLSDDGSALEVSLTGIGMTGKESAHATLHHSDAAARSFQNPRMDRAGERVRDYSYSAPHANDDGIPVANAAKEGVDPKLLEKLVNSVLAESGERDKRQTEGVLVLRHGKLLFEEYFWGQTADNPHIISSCTKSVTSILAGIAADQGRLHTQASMASFFPETRDNLWARSKEPISVKNALSMSSGTAWDDKVKGPENPSWMLLQAEDLPAFMLNRPVIHPPGSVYNYDNGLPALMGAVLSRVTREPLERFADRVLFAPLGISNYRWTRMPDGTPLAAGGFYMLPRDMAKIGLLMLNEGRWKGRKILSSQWVAESTRQQTAADQYPYGYYWHLTNDKHRHVKTADGYLALGQGGQIIAVFPALDLVVVVTSQNWAMPGLTSMPFGLFDDFILPAVSPSSAQPSAAAG
jgi:CubicO group peptidase (beta-lactamase class C family)